MREHRASLSVENVLVVRMARERESSTIFHAKGKIIIPPIELLVNSMEYISREPAICIYVGILYVRCLGFRS